MRSALFRVTRDEYTAFMARRRALVESVAIVLTPRCLRLSPCSLVDTSLRVLRLPSLSAHCQFRIVTALDGVPVRLDLPRQPLTIDPPRWLPSQSIGITHDLIPHPTGLHRRPWFSCPACEHRCARLYLPDDQDRFACRLCFSLEYRSHCSTHWRVYRTTVQAYPSLCLSPPYSSTKIRALPVWYRWRTEGKGRKRYWLGQEQGTKPSAAHPSPKRRGRPRALNDREIGSLIGKVQLGIPRDQIIREWCGFISRQTLSKYITENLPLFDGFEC